MICDLCPRRCGALRTEVRGLGRCRMPELPVLARAALHRWEEPPISGTRGSGTIFFSGCSLGCVFCQNEEISHRDFGKAVTLERLARICGELVDQGAHNLNFVNPTHYAHVVGRLLEEHPQPVPVVWNSGGYDRVDTLRALEGKIQVYLPDLKYLDSDAAGRYSGASDYPQTAQAAIREMVRQTGPCAFDGDGLLTRGVVIRHLPGQSGQGSDGLGGGGVRPRDCALLPDEPVHPLGPVGGISRDPPAAPGRGDAGGGGIYGKSGAGGLYPGADQRPAGIYTPL